MIIINTSAGAWYDLWHQHPDINGEGNANKAARTRSLKSLKAAYLAVQQQLKDWTLTHQSWALIDPKNSGQDAVFVHTPNPNQDNFPYPFEGVVWFAPRIPKWLKDVFPTEEFTLGRSVYNGNVMYWAVSPNKVFNATAAVPPV